MVYFQGVVGAVRPREERFWFRVGHLKLFCRHHLEGDASLQTCALCSPCMVHIHTPPSVLLDQPVPEQGPGSHVLCTSVLAESCSANDAVQETETGWLSKNRTRKEEALRAADNPSAPSGFLPRTRLNVYSLSFGVSVNHCILFNKTQ